MEKMKKLKDTKFMRNRDSRLWKKVALLKEKRWVRFVRKTKVYSFLRYRLIPHLYLFWLPWSLLLLILISALSCSPSRLVWLAILMALFVFLLVMRPLNVIHGLIGTRGDIRMFFFMFLLINVLISVVYYYGFFKNAGITFDVSQPHVEFGLFEKLGKDVDAMMVEDGKPIEMVQGGVVKELKWNGIVPRKAARIDANFSNKVERIPPKGGETAHFYHRINYRWVLQNTLTTSLMQEPTEFYSFACTYSGDHEEGDRNIKMANGFHWFLLFHILISWIVLGVFIALIYQKFRNN